MFAGFLQFFSFHSLRFKFSLIAGLVFLCIFSVASFVLIEQTSDFEKQSLVSQAKTYSKLATKPMGDAYNVYFNAGSLKFREVFEEVLSLNQSVPRVQIISVTGEILFDSEALEAEETVAPTQINDQELLQAIASDKETELKDDQGNISEIIVPYSNDFGSRPFSLRYFISYESIYENINRAIMTIALLLAILFGVTLVAITFLVNSSILSPLGKIVETARDISQGKLEKRIELNTKDELADLAVSLNHMTQTLKNNIESLKQVDSLKDEFIFIASHNLRTPLTVIKDYLPFLKEKNLDEESLSAVQGIEDSTAKLETISESLINLVSLEKEKEPLRRSATDLVSLIGEVVENHHPQAAEKKIGIVFEKPAHPINLSLDRVRIKQAVASIIDNAIKFNRESGQVVVSLWVKDGQVLISIADTGVGIAPEELGKIFQKFHRGTEVLTYNYEGIGIGLYLAKVIIESHQGQIWIKSTLDKGTIVTVSLPLGSGG